MSSKLAVLFALSAATGVVAFSGSAAAGSRQIPASACYVEAPADFEFVYGLGNTAASERRVLCPIANDDQLVVSVHPWSKPNIQNIWVDTWDGNGVVGADVRVRSCHYIQWSNTAFCSRSQTISSGTGVFNANLTRGTDVVNQLVDPALAWWYSNLEITLPAAAGPTEGLRSWLRGLVIVS